MVSEPNIWPKKMAEKGSEVGEKLVTSSNPSSTENPTIQITALKLNGENFLQWA
ncbi:hypothetical protein AAG906_037052 [Vitis piasezkii]